MNGGLNLLLLNLILSDQYLFPLIADLETTILKIYLLFHHNNQDFRLCERLHFLNMRCRSIPCERLSDSMLSIIICFSSVFDWLSRSLSPSLSSCHSKVLSSFSWGTDNWLICSRGLSLIRLTMSSIAKSSCKPWYCVSNPQLSGNSFSWLSSLFPTIG